MVCGDGGVIGLGGDNLRPEGGVGGEYAMEANEMEPGTRDQGGQALVFANCALQEIAKHSRGNPRLLSMLCDDSLSAGFLSREKPITQATVQEVIANYRTMVAAARQRVHGRVHGRAPESVSREQRRRTQRPTQDAKSASLTRQRRPPRGGA